MNDFTASNGIAVYRTPGGNSISVLARDGHPMVAVGSYYVEAVAEFIRAEEDARLRRFRDPSTPDYVAYDRGDGYVRVVREVDGTSEVFLRQDVEAPGGFKLAIVARAFFDTQRERRDT